MCSPEGNHKQLESKRTGVASAWLLVKETGKKKSTVGTIRMLKQWVSNRTLGMHFGCPHSHQSVEMWISGGA